MSDIRTLVVLVVAICFPEMPEMPESSLPLQSCLRRTAG